MFSNSGGFLSIFVRLSLLVLFTGVRSLDHSAKVAISNWTTLDDKLFISCSILTDSKTEKDMYKVHLVCPLIEGASCYVDCESQCDPELGGCAGGILGKVFYTCNYLRSENKIDIFYQLNRNFINVSGQWMCQYAGIKSKTLTIEKHSFRPSTSARTSSQTTELTRLRPLKIVSSVAVKEVTFHLSEIQFIIILIVFVGSLLVNLTLIIVASITKRKLWKTKRIMKRKENSKDPTETTSMITRSSTHHQLLNRSNCTRTPSLDSPSFRESIATYLPESSAVITAHSASTEPQPYYIDQCGRLIRILQPMNSFPIEGADVLSRHSSGELASPFRPIIQGNIMLPQRMPSHGSYVSNWTHMNPQHQESVSSIQGCSSHQQIYLDSNDESGLGSQSLTQSVKQPNGSFHGCSDKVDLILDCNPNLNNIIRSPTMVNRQDHEIRSEALQPSSRPSTNEICI